MAGPGLCTFAGVAFDEDNAGSATTTDWARGATYGLIDIPFGAPLYQLPEGAQAPEERPMDVWLTAAAWVALQTVRNVWGTLATPNAAARACFLSHWDAPERFLDGDVRVRVYFRG